MDRQRSQRSRVVKDKRELANSEETLQARQDMAMLFLALKELEGLALTSLRCLEGH